jgi:DUF4097 and DUF4098 domain-containing protein YvlB
VLDAQTVNGSISVTSWDGPDILVRAQVVTAANGEWLAAALAAQVTLQTAGGIVVGRGPSTHEDQQWSLALEIFVPAQSGLSLSTVNGSISAGGVRGPIEFNTTNGSVSIAGDGGDVRGRGVNGSITVSAGGDHWQGQTLDVRTVNGGIDLKVPRDCAAHVELSTVLGDISTDFPVSGWARVGLGRKLTFDLGTSGLVRASTTLGRIDLTSVSTRGRHVSLR